ncbi:hypothetical protein EI546_01590 [Aequorivita sp. H23M31]|uniref:Lipocalin-like domain-containing protein n=1 Tax=Aequorivita ciconiae TaxID=2494375 RepID=A0A410FZS1_9FLAO|nr:hypothetical protein [Aequorivita sp. H23M31]QAA80500.1 hypothetical protein EI546_01590 [Aequorivita sp. H23M31]
MKKLVLLSVIVFGLILTSCSNDDNDDVIKEEVTLEGDWRVTNIDFSVMTEGGFPASDACIWELVTGFEFHADKSFYYILGDLDRPLFDPYAQDYWTWSGDTDGFTINQTNPRNPPYSFALTPVQIGIDNTGDKPVLTFEAELSNGSYASFRLVKEAIDKTKFPAVTDPDGNTYQCGFFD